ncbi:hypothetical protein [Clostridium sp.]|jgi:hypothetical protein|uniref:hypothetical protein n=1 Tax=Clostridium sp. TaxID=1506 RepID=UPI003A5BEB64
MGLFDERDNTVKDIINRSIKYTYGFIILISAILVIVGIMANDIVIIPNGHLFGNYYIYIHIGKNTENILAILIVTQAFVSIIARSILNRRSGSKHITKEKIQEIIDRCIAVSFLYIMIFLLMWIIIDIIVNNILGLSMILFFSTIIFYIAMKTKLKKLNK